MSCHLKLLTQFYARTLDPITWNTTTLSCPFQLTRYVHRCREWASKDQLSDLSIYLSICSSHLHKDKAKPPIQLLSVRACVRGPPFRTLYVRERWQIHNPSYLTCQQQLPDQTPCTHLVTYTNLALSCPFQSWLLMSSLASACTQRGTTPRMSATKSKVIPESY